MKVSHYKVEFDLKNLLVENLPWVSEFYSSKSELNDDVKELFDFHIKNANNMPFYHLSEKGLANIKFAADRAYQTMVDALEYAFSTPDLIEHFFDCEMLRSDAGKDFIAFAKYTFEQDNLIGQSVYSRFDMAFDPVTEQVTGIYELNADTPTMLFESTSMQDYLLKQITDGDDAYQANDWFATVTESLKQTIHSDAKNKKFGVVFDSNYIEDSVTCELMADLLSQFATTMLVDVKQLHFEHAEKRTPWVAYDEHFLDGMFILLPWEEMVINFPQGFFRWKEWCNDVVMIEPAWKWFMSHKGILALVTHLQESGEMTSDVKTIPFLKTYLGNGYLRGNMHIEKPTVGRMSHNVKVIDAQGNVVSDSGGVYTNETMVYQEYCPPSSLREGTNFILGVWMAPVSARMGKEAYAQGVAIREFDSTISNIKNERFVPHTYGLLDNE